jgi:hypothetical protein
VGSGQLYRAPLADVAAAGAAAHLRLQQPFQAECDASYVAYHDRRVWVGEFVSAKDNRFPGQPAHRLKDRDGHPKYAWACGYALDADENLPAAAGDRPPPPAAVLSVREHVQGMAFLDGRIILSTSYGRAQDSHLAVYKNPLPGEWKKPHATVKVGGENVPLWFLDGKNQVGRGIDFPPMSEGVTAYRGRLAVVCESGAEKYREKGHVPLDSIIFLAPPEAR